MLSVIKAVEAGMRFAARMLRISSEKRNNVGALIYFGI